MKAPAHPTSSPTDTPQRSGGGASANYAGDRSIAIFKLGLDISPLRPRQRYVVRALLQRMTGMALDPSPGSHS